MPLLSNNEAGYSKLNLWAVILAAGSGSRFSTGEAGPPKQFVECGGKPLFWHAARNISKCAPICGLIFVFPEDPLKEKGELVAGYSDLLREIDPNNELGLERKVVIGGKTRRESSLAGVRSLPSSCKAVLIHDAARPNVSPELIMRVAKALLEGHPAVVPGLPVTDTVKLCDADSIVTRTVDREGLYTIQTPQGFNVDQLLRAHNKAENGSWEVTDDAMIMERAGCPVFVVKGDPDNLKITYPEDLQMFFNRLNAPFFGMPGCAAVNGSGLVPCTGFGYDVHRYGGERPFVLGGVPIATDIKVAAHSDGDTLLHALVDALLGLAGEGDIGRLFPDTDAAYDNMESGIFLAETLALCREKGIRLSHVDITIIAQTPRIDPHRENIAANLAKLMQLPKHAVNVKATTEEGLGFTGEKKGIKVVAVVSGLRLGAF